jgi:DNA-directed RNA polymerase
MIMEYDDIKELAQTNSKELIRIINSSTLKVKELSTAIEILAEESIEEQLILPIFLRLLKHIHVSVRESTIFGIISFYENKQLPKLIMERLNIISKNDPSSDIKELALEFLIKNK